MKTSLPLVALIFVVLNLACLSLAAQQQYTINPYPLGSISSALSESSGIAVTAPNKIWSVNDSGNPNKIFCLDTNGVINRSITVSNAQNNDWEDLALDAAGNLYICDAGNNNNERHNLKILKLPNPDQIAGESIEAEIIDFVFEDQNAFPPPQSNLNFDIEAIVHRYGYLYLFTKNRSTPQNGWCKLYRLPATAGNYTASLLDSINLGTNNDDARVTAADIHPQTGELVLLTANRLISFTGYVGDRFFNGNKTLYNFATEQGQIEAIHFYDSKKLYMTEEASSNHAGKIYRIDIGIFSSINASDAENQIKLFPNPSNGEFKLKLPIPGSFRTRLFSGTGKLINTFTIENGSQLQLQHLPAGAYLLSVELPQGTTQKRFVIH